MNVRKNQIIFLIIHDILEQKTGIIYLYVIIIDVLNVGLIINLQHYI